MACDTAFQLTSHSLLLPMMDASSARFPLVALALLSMPKRGKLDTKKKRVRKVAVKQKSLSRSRVPVLGHADASGQQQLQCQPSRPTHAINGDSVCVNSFTSGLSQRFYLACHRKVADFFCWSPMPRTVVKKCESLFRFVDYLDPQVLICLLSFFASTI